MRYSRLYRLNTNVKVSTICLKRTRVAELDELAKKLERPRSQLIDFAVRDFLRKMNEQGGKEKEQGNG
jgi:metal-responsive CopG/Arc/MetJ family transcriptional regulator